MTLPLYRREKRQDQTCVVKTPTLTRRSPSFIPYLVDNLWEWQHPEHLPNCRHAVFANPDCDAIQVSGSCFNIQMFGICKVAPSPQKSMGFRKPQKLSGCLGTRSHRDRRISVISCKGGCCSVSVQPPHLPNEAKSSNARLFNRSLIHVPQTTHA